MGKVRAQQDHVVRFKMVDIVADELPPRSLDDVYQFDLGMIMPFVIEMRHDIIPHVERMLGLQMDLQQMRFHDCTILIVEWCYLYTSDGIYVKIVQVVDKRVQKNCACSLYFWI